jgi:hypothetical protein
MMDNIMFMQNVRLSILRPPRCHTERGAVEVWQRGAQYDKRTPGVR